MVRGSGRPQPVQRASSKSAEKHQYDRWPRSLRFGNREEAILSIGVSQIDIELLAVVATRSGRQVVAAISLNGLIGARLPDRAGDRRKIFDDPSQAFAAKPFAKGVLCLLP